MNCITLTEPWATLVAIGAKTIETRSWPAPRSAIGQPLAIHAAKGMAGDDLDWLAETPAARQALAVVECRCWPNCWPAAGYPRPAVKDAFAATRGRVLATCRLVASEPMPRFAYQDKRLWTPATGDIELSDDELAFGNFERHRWAWVLRDVVALPEPAPARGALGIWQWTQQGVAR
ncbi:MAG TPA: hypothetical protein VFU81_07755 [Thermomicrobiales bacterium]|nr:hypothetical protein [Thermomicrobiales bacterium]